MLKLTATEVKEKTKFARLKKRLAWEEHILPTLHVNSMCNAGTSPRSSLPLGAWKEGDFEGDFWNECFNAH